MESENERETNEREEKMYENMWVRRRTRKKCDYDVVMYGSRKILSTCLLRAEETCSLPGLYTLAYTKNDKGNVKNETW